MFLSEKAVQKSFNDMFFFKENHSVFKSKPVGSNAGFQRCILLARRANPAHMRVLVDPQLAPRKRYSKLT
jgi:hypothetical protein